MRFSPVIPALLAVVALFTGCAGYSLGPVKPSSMAGIETIAVPVFGNDTLEPRLEVPTTSSVVRQFQNDGTYRITTVKDADAVLEGNIVAVTRNPARSVRGNVISTLEFDVQVTLAFTLIDNRSGRELAIGTVTGSSTFFVGNDVSLDQTQAIPRAVDELSIRLVSRIAEGW